MSIQTQINRLQTNTTNALAALADKGVSVPAGANSDSLADLIASIETGGSGGGDGIAVNIVNNTGYEIVIGSTSIAHNATATVPLAQELNGGFIVMFNSGSSELANSKLRLSCPTAGLKEFMMTVARSEIGMFVGTMQLQVLEAYWTMGMAFDLTAGATVELSLG